MKTYYDRKITSLRFGHSDGQPFAEVRVVGHEESLVHWKPFRVYKSDEKKVHVIDPQQTKDFRL